VDSARFPELIADLYKVVAALEAMFPGRHFTPDGHLVGSIGEALASHHYGVELFSASAQGHDGRANGRLVQVKATQGTRVALSSEPEHLLVLRLHKNGTFTEEYNGPGQPVWASVSHKARPGNGQYQVSISALRRLTNAQDAKHRLPRQTAA
jgi:hypothetical protein